jgi:hypothetical protein
VADEFKKEERTVAAILAAYYIEGEQVDTATTVPAGDGAAGQDTAHLNTNKKKIPKWDDVKTWLAMVEPESLVVEQPDAVKANAPTAAVGKDSTLITDDKTPHADVAAQAKHPDPKNELSEAEGKALRLEDVVRFNKGSIVYYGYKMPWVSHLDPAKPEHKALIDVVKEVRRRVEKVPISGLKASPPKAGETVTTSMPGVGPAQSNGKPLLTFARIGITYRLTFMATYGGVDRDVSADVAWTSSDPKVARIEKGTITTLKQGTATISGVYKEQTLEVDVVIDVKAKTPSPPSPAKNPAQQTGSLVWTQYPRPSGNPLQGWMYDDDKNTVPPSVTMMFDRFLVALSSGKIEREWLATAVVRKVAQEGSSSALNTYDGMVLTIGSGNAADGAMLVIARAVAESEDVRRFLYMCGFSCEKQPDYVEQGTKLPRYAIKFLDLSDDANPRILYWDMDYHFYGHVPAGKGQKVGQSVHPPSFQSGLANFPKGYDPNLNSASYASGGPHPFNIFRHVTPSAKPADDSYGLEKNNIEVLHALIALRRCHQPPTGSAFFGIDYEKSLHHVGHGIANITRRATYIFAAMIHHNWGFRSMAKFPETYLSSAEAAVVAQTNLTGEDDIHRNGLIAKALARGVAVELERCRLKNCLARWKKGSTIQFESVEMMKGSGWWGFGRVVDYWKEMTTGKGRNNEGAVDALSGLAKLYPDLDKRIASIQMPSGSALTRAELDAHIKDVQPVNRTSFNDGFDVTKTIPVNGAFNAGWFYAKDYTDQAHIGEHGGGYFCLGPKDTMKGSASVAGLPPIVLKYARSFTLINVEDVMKGKNKVGIKATWNLTYPGMEGQQVFTDAAGVILP